MGPATSSGNPPSTLDLYGSEERHRVYRMSGLEAHPAPDGSFGTSGDAVSFSRVGISSS